jgi:hypothetical protein
MKKNNHKAIYYVLILAVSLSVIYALCKEIVPEQTRKEINVELKLNK